jgi:hypothetical protein
MLVSPVVVSPATASNSYLPQAKKNSVSFGYSSQSSNADTTNTLWAVSGIVGTVGILALAGLMFKSVHNMDKASKTAVNSAEKANNEIAKYFSNWNDFLEKNPENFNKIINSLKKGLKEALA